MKQLLLVAGMLLVPAGAVAPPTVIVTHVAVEPAGKFDLDDFQLVRDRAARLGDEVNLGDNGDSDYFYWTFLDASGLQIAQVSGETVPFMARLAFKVPAAARRGYLFHRGLYYGPFDFR